MAPNACKSNCWSTLKDDLLQSVANRLCFEDLIRFSFVCRSWKSFITTRSSSLVFPKPHLWLINPDSSCETRSLRNFYDDRIYEVDTPQLLDHRICGSCLGGWLVTTHENGNIQVFHPFSKSLFHLPPLLRFPGIELMSDDEEDDSEEEEYSYDGLDGLTRTIMHEYFVYKVILSSDRRIAVAIYAFERRLGFCKVGEDETWIALNVKGEVTSGFQDVIFYRGKFYAVRSSGAVFVVSGLETESPFIELAVGRPPSYEEDDEYDFEEYSKKYYLVKSLGGEMMLIMRVLRFPPKCEGGQGEYETEVFRVAKLDIDQWVRVKEFGNDSSFFVGRNHSFSVSNSNLPNPYNMKRNYIFFTDDYMDQDQDPEKENGGDDFGQFDLNNGTSRKWGCRGRYLPPAVWFTTIST